MWHAVTEPTQEDIERGAEALHEKWCGCKDRYVGSDDTWLARARTVLAAVLPAHDERVRADLLTELQRKALDEADGRVDRLEYHVAGWIHRQGAELRDGLTDPAPEPLHGEDPWGDDARSGR